MLNPVVLKQGKTVGYCIIVKITLGYFFNGLTIFVVYLSFNIFYRGYFIIIHIRSGFFISILIQNSDHPFYMVQNVVRIFNFDSGFVIANDSAGIGQQTLGYTVSGIIALCSG